VPRIALFKLTSCSGCLNEALLALLEGDVRAEYEVVYFTEALDVEAFERADIALVEGSVTNKHQEELLKTLRSRVDFLVALGTCAVMGGVQALRVEGGVEEAKRAVYPRPELVEAYGEPLPLSAVVKVDYEVPGCPASREAVLELLRKYALGGLPVAIYESVCAECKRAGVPCVVVTRGVPCLGPVTRSSCGAICPRFERGCHGCYGLLEPGLDGGRLRALEERLRSMGLDSSSYTALMRAYSYRAYKRLVGGDA